MDYSLQKVYRSVGFSRQESVELPFPSQDNMLDSFKIELKSEVVGNLLKSAL